MAGFKLKPSTNIFEWIVDKCVQISQCDIDIIFLFLSSLFMAMLGRATCYKWSKEPGKTKIVPDIMVMSDMSALANSSQHSVLSQYFHFTDLASGLREAPGHRPWCL